jgi:hypothetical protein
MAKMMADKKRHMKKRSTPAPRETDDELSPEFKRELRRRIADMNDPVRYAVFSDIGGLGRWRLWLDVSDGVYGMTLDQATLFKKKDVAQAAAKAYSAGKKNRLHIAKITTKNGKRRVLKYE